MPSRLVGLIRRLTWDDFKGAPSAAELAKLRQAAANANGQTVGMAGTASTFSVNFGGANPEQPVMNSDGSQFTLDDNIVITIAFDSMRSWKRIDPLSNLGQQFLLDHEQGHYDITALMARDCFIDIMQLKAKAYATALAGQTEARDLFKSHKDKLQPAQDKYDDDTTHGAWVVPSFLPERKSSFQTNWENFFQRSFTQPRQPPVQSPDGVAYKLRLLDVLAQGGFTI